MMCLGMGWYLVLLLWVAGYSCLRVHLGLGVDRESGKSMLATWLAGWMAGWNIPLRG
ncbi:uncharacterized protein THITE_2112109 [Thermothielavioides terrestris NRRL 8126]|uniref:Uncharacterized protein n=1 Tax=Thermothielavioides terrestris (strain ATCC 38088 / NRRL 8126) TaxID=578455 RepID=G2R4Z3_THETT|nr:uncharacterized protein THITE_2112109 [Thermothielavioides terrestris NRRL 8126]AEO65270.1 hypothetical protein THITE_2112109 [Thermothielavioides terrestris NRRL 8126]